MAAGKSQQKQGAGWRRTAAALGGLALVMGTFLAGSAWKVVRDYQALPPPVSPAGVPVSAVVLDREDRLLRAFISRDQKWRLPVALNEIDPLYLKLLLAFEDKRFYGHGGVDGRAVLRSVLQSLRHGRIVSGGSTLTMQVARLLEEHTTRSLQRKYHQFLKAVQLEQTLTKDEILTLYALRAPFGGNLEGVRAASLTWLGKEPGRLTPAEAALLVALPQSPEARRPDRHPERARAARNRVLARAQAAGVLSAEATASAQAEPVRARRHAMPFLAPHESRAAYFAAPNQPVHRLTLNKNVQASLEQLARRRVQALPVPVSLAIVVADHQSGEILASVGAPDLLDDTRFGHVDMTRALRSPGSTLKPFIYGLAFEEGIGLPESLIVDRPTDIGGYRPTNFDRAYQGTVTLREALLASLNTPAVQLLEAVGPVRLMARLKRAGARPVLDRKTGAGLAIGLGGLGLSLKDLAQAYAALAGGGRPVQLHVCRSGCGTEQQEKVGKASVLSPKAAALVSGILTGMPQVQSTGTNKIAYKTGTSYGYRDAWAAGYDGRFVVAVWVGRPDGSPVPGQTGRTAAVPILQDTFQVLGARRVPLPALPPSFQDLLEDRPPAPLRYARTAARQSADTERASLRIAFPPEGAELDLGVSDATGDAETAQPLVVKFKGGTAPYGVLINERPLGYDTLDRQLVWQPEAPGFASVTILDARGQRAGVTVQIR